jgi:antitoxin YefM
MSVDEYESIMETWALINDPVDQERLREAERSVAAGDITSASRHIRARADAYRT